MFYYDNLLSYQLETWYLLIPCGILIGWFSTDQKIQRITQFSTIIVISYFLIISYAKTKLVWYDFPMYPFFSILIAVSIYFVFDLIRSSEHILKHIKWNVLPFLFLLLIFVNPYRAILDATYKPKEVKGDKEFYELGYFLKKAVKAQHSIGANVILYEGYNAHNLFYIKILNDQGQKIKFKNWKNLNAGDHALVYQHQIKDYLVNHYQCDTLLEEGNVIIYAIHGKKQQKRS